MKKILTLIVILSLFGHLNGQIISATGSCTTSSGGAITTSVLQTPNAGSELAVGYFSGTMDMNPTAVSAPVSSNGNTDIFIQKFDDGVYQWGKGIGGNGMDKAVEVVGFYNEIYVTGIFSGTVDFNPNAGIFNLTSNGGTDIFIMKLDAAGNFLWAKSFGGVLDDDVRSMIYTSSNVINDFSLYLTGTFQGTADLNPGVTTISNFTSNGMKDVYIEKLDPNGNFIWAKKVGGTKDDISDDIACNGPNGELYVVGNFTEKADMDPSTLINNVETGIDKIAYFILKLNLSGIFNFVKKIDKPSNTGNYLGQIFEWSIIASEGFIMVSGEFNLELDFDPNAGNQNYISNTSFSSGFLLKLTNFGNFDWIRIFRPTSTEIDIKDMVEAPGEIYITGTCIGVCDFDNTSASALSMVNNTSYHVYVLCYKKDGTFQWIRQFENCGQGTAYSMSTWSHGGYNHLVFGGSISPITPINTADIFPGDNTITIPVVQINSPFIVKWIIDEFYNYPILPESGPKSFTILDNEVIKLYPNPTNRFVFINDENSLARYSIMNQLGEKIGAPITFKEDGWECDLDCLPSGIYYIYNELEKEPKMQKVVLNN